MNKRSSTHRVNDISPAYVITRKATFHKVSYADPGCYIEENKDKKMETNDDGDVLKSFRGRLRGVEFSNVWIKVNHVERV